MKKSIKILLGVLGVAALLGVCFFSLSIYAKKEINTPKFELPEAQVVQPVSALPATKEAAFDYVNGLYDACIAADDVEVNMHTDIHLTEGERVSPLSDADNAVLSRALEQAQGGIAGFYPLIENTVANTLTPPPALGFTKADVTDFTAVQGSPDENGEMVDDGFYYITLTVAPSAIDAEAMANSDAAKSIRKELAPMMNIPSLVITPDGFTATFKIEYATDMLTWVELKKHSNVRATVAFTEEYKALSDKEESFELPFETVESIDLFHYGLRFTERQMAVEKKDMKALPLDVRVDAETTKEEYNLTFEVSKDGILEIDQDGVMSVIGTQEEPVTVTATLDYDGHVYKDSMIIYATELEVKTDEP